MKYLITLLMAISLNASANCSSPKPTYGVLKNDFKGYGKIDVKKIGNYYQESTELTLGKEKLKFFVKRGGCSHSMRTVKFVLNDKKPVANKKYYLSKINTLLNSVAIQGSESWFQQIKASFKNPKNKKSILANGNLHLVKGYSSLNFHVVRNEGKEVELSIMHILMH